MSNQRTLGVLSLGIIIGLGYAIACGSQGDSTSLPSIPGVGKAWAQSADCDQWEVQGLEVMNEHAVLPEGWAPLGTQGGNAYWIWMVRCAQ